MAISTEALDEIERKTKDPQQYPYMVIGMGLASDLVTEVRRLRKFERAWDDEEAGEHGPYMCWDDYAPLESERDSLQKECDALTAEVVRLHQRLKHEQPTEAKIETLREMLQRTLVDGNPQAIAARLIDEWKVYTDDLESEVTQLRDELKRVHDAINKHESPKIALAEIDSIALEAISTKSALWGGHNG
jgi:DNA repair exonuclease SbcCD ATPase subunit